MIAGFVVDFYCAAARLAVEVDGAVHAAQQAYDAERDLALSDLGIRTLRLTNESVLNDLAQTLRRIAENLTPNPSP